MGITDHWMVYKWFQNGRIPANLIRPYEVACGIDFVTRWIAASSGRQLVDVATGRNLNPADIVATHEHFASTVKRLSAFYAQPGDPTETLAALTIQACFSAYDMEELRIDYTVGGGANRVERGELVTYSWDRQAEPAGLF